MAGPLVRSSMALRASSVARLDPFEAPEPEPQPFVEQLRAEQQQESVGGSGAQTGLMAALRRSISGAGSNSRRTPRQSVEGAAWANRQAQQVAYQQQQQERTQQAPEAGVQFLDLDATRAYALGVHQVMMRLEQGMQSHHSQSEASSKPASPRMASCFAEAAAAPAPAEAAAAVEADAADAAGSEEQALSEGSSHRQLQEGEVEVQDDGDEAAYRQSAQGARVIDSRPTETGPLSAGQHTLHAGDAAVMPPLRSGMSSPAASRRQTLAAASRAGSAAPRQLPLMGQASMEILQTRPQHQQLQQQQQGSLTASRQASLVGASTSLSLAEVYKQTSGNLMPLSSHLSGIGRRPSRCVWGHVCVCSSSAVLTGRSHAQLRLPLLHALSDSTPHSPLVQYCPCVPAVAVVPTRRTQAHSSSAAPAASWVKPALKRVVLHQEGWAPCPCSTAAPCSRPRSQHTQRGWQQVRLSSSAARVLLAGPAPPPSLRQALRQRAVMLRAPTTSMPHPGASWTQAACPGRAP
jgi:hypothetical protein